MKSLKLLFLPLLILQISFSQVVIKERVEINPGENQKGISQDSIASETEFPIYTRYGGFIYLTQVLGTSHELWEQSLGQITGDKQTGNGFVILLDDFPQWHKFIFYLRDTSTGAWYYPSYFSASIINPDVPGQFLLFHIDGEPESMDEDYPDAWWAFGIDPDYSLASMPPDEMLDFYGNPFSPSDPMLIPVSGNIYAVIKNVSSDVNDKLWIDAPETRLIEDDLTSKIDSVIDLGHMEAGETIRFFITSPHSIVSGNNLYPNQIPYGATVTGSGDVLLWSLKFEDWTDLLFDNLEMELYISPDEEYVPVAVIFEPETLAPGDTALVTIKRRLLDGSLTDFSSDQTFEIGLIEGCDAGTILTCYAGNCQPGTYFNNIPQAISVYFVADSAVENASATIRAGLIEQVSASSIKEIDNGKDSNAEAAVTDENDFCFSGTFNSETFGDGQVAIETDDCDEEIVECDCVQPQKYTNDGIEVLVEDQTWQWVDEQGEIQTTSTGSSCDHKMPSICDSLEFGKTYIMTHIGDYAPGKPVYNLLDDMKVTTCLDKCDPDDEVWQFRVDNIRVPIFSAHCPDMPAKCGWTDLGDGTDGSLLSQYIWDCSSYEKIMDIVQWWVQGTYWNAMKKINITDRIYFSAGTIAHENVHIDQTRSELLKEMKRSTGLPMILMLKLRSLVAYPCPKDALAQQKDRVQQYLVDRLLYAGDLKKRMGYTNGQAKSELKADYKAGFEYKQIGNNITNWAKQQSWWKQKKCN